MLSLAPRFDLFKFELPKSFIPEELNEKYSKILNKNASVITNPIDYLNESIQAVNFPGISGIVITQQQHSTNPINVSDNGRRKLNVEPKTDITYYTTASPLDKINKEFRVSFRMNQGLYNYFLIYETIFHHTCKHINRPCFPVLYLEILDEDGVSVSRIIIKDVFIDGIEGLNFNYDKIIREAEVFDITFKFNNIDFEYI